MFHFWAVFEHPLQLHIENDFIACSTTFSFECFQAFLLYICCKDGNSISACDSRYKKMKVGGKKMGAEEFLYSNGRGENKMRIVRWHAEQLNELNNRYLDMNNFIIIERTERIFTLRSFAKSRKSVFHSNDNEISIHRIELLFSHFRKLSRVSGTFSFRQSKDMKRIMAWSLWVSSVVVDNHNMSSS